MPNPSKSLDIVRNQPYLYESATFVDILTFQRHEYTSATFSLTVAEPCLATRQCFGGRLSTKDIIGLFERLPFQP